MNNNGSDNGRRPLSWVDWILLVFGVIGALSGLVTILTFFGVLRGDVGAFVNRTLAFLSVSSRVIVLGAVLFLVVLIGYRLRRLLRRGIVRGTALIGVGYGRLIAWVLRPVLPRVAGTVRYSEPIVFQHFTTGVFLTSLDGRYYNPDPGSGQQVVFGAIVPDDNSVWWIEGQHGGALDAFRGRFVEKGAWVRIYHVASDQYLHSHVDRSPASTDDNVQREVSVSSQNNVQDNWRIEGAGTIPFGTLLRIEHADGNQYLHSHDRECKPSERASSREVTCCPNRNDDDYWIPRRAESLGLKCSPPQSDKALRIYWGTFGAGRMYKNVTAILRREVRDSHLSISAYADRVGTQQITDPCPGTPKQLSVHYSVNGVRSHKAVGENQPLYLP